MINIDLEELKRLYYDEQKSAYEIAQHFKTNHSTIYGRMKNTDSNGDPLQMDRNYGTQKQGSNSISTRSCVCILRRS